MQDQWGNAIVQTTSAFNVYYVFTRTVDGLVVSYRTTLGLAQATALAINSFNGMAPPANAPTQD